MPRFLRQFGLRTLLLVCGVVAVCCGAVRWHMNDAARQHALAAEITERHGNVRWQSWGPDWLHVTLGSYYFQSIQSVNWNGRFTQDDDLRLLREITTLEELDLSNTMITDPGLKVLEDLPRLRTLILDETNVTEKGLKHVGSLRELETLDVRCTGITEEGLVHLRGLPKLKTLHFQHDDYWRGIFELTDVGIEHLATLPNLVVEKLRCQSLSPKSIEWIRGQMTLNELTLDQPQGDAWADILLGHPKLQRLHVYQAAMRDEQLQKMLQADRFTMLTLHDVPIGDAALVKPQKAMRLRDLTLRGTRVTQAGVFANYGADARDLTLVEDPSAPKMVSFYLASGFRGLKVSWNGEFHNDDWEQLKHFPHLQMLAVRSGNPEETYLDFEGHMLTWDDDRPHCQVDDAALQIIVRQPDLMELDLSGPQAITPEGMTALVEVKRLCRLRLRSTGMTDEHMTAIALLRQLSQLVVLRQAITDDGVAELASLKNLELLVLGHCKRLTDRSLQTVAKFQKLERLVAKDVPFGDEGLRYLFNMPQLTDVDLYDTMTTPKGRADLQRSLPKSAQIAP